MRPLESRFHSEFLSQLDPENQQQLLFVSNAEMMERSVFLIPHDDLTRKWLFSIFDNDPKWVVLIRNLFGYSTKENDKITLIKKSISNKMNTLVGLSRSMMKADISHEEFESMNRGFLSELQTILEYREKINKIMLGIDE